ncbi:MAG TPA: Gldg family protein [Candidatus Obscuribacterales bacterium]
MNNIKRIAAKELYSFFSSLTAFIFFAAFLSVLLFIFFWAETFFARNIADVRPMFEWMPLIMVFMVPALTMRMWSEERRSGTLELLLTAPPSNLELVLGKFAACMAVVAIALVLTLPIPMTVALLAGPLDWGPVAGGYAAALFLAAAYTAIGLTLSARTDNQIVSLLVSVLVCGLFFLVGSDGLTSLFSGNVGELLKLLGSSSRFQSITRGIIDFRDVYYYLSITGVFLSLNVLGLEKLRWAGNAVKRRHKQWIAVTALSAANLIAGNYWMQQLDWARLDLTAGQIYSISPATRKYLAALREPLLIRGYFSKRTHPLLQPLVPRLRDLLKEYAIAGNGKVRVEFVDPIEKPELEKEAVERYGIKPVVFQTANKYQAALTNSYFDVLVKYADQYQKLSWKDLIEVKVHGERDIDVDLRNPEYDITSTIKKVLLSYQGSGNLFLGIEHPLTFTAYVSADERLPEPLRRLKKLLLETLDNLKKQSAGKLSVQWCDPDAQGGQLAKKIEADYGFKPMVLGLFDPGTFWFYMTLKSGEQLVQIPLPEEVNRGALERSIQAGLKRFSKGFLKTIGIMAPPSPPQFARGGQGVNMLRERLSDAYALQDVTLEKGHVPPNIDILLLIAPESLTEKQLFAADQFLMKGGTIILCTSPFTVDVERTMSLRTVTSGLESWLRNYGIDIQKTMVLDKQNFPLPIPTRRMVAGFMLEETQLVPYPYFVDVRDSGSRIMAGINQVILNWPSPIVVDRKKNQGRQVFEILLSSPDAWTSDERDVEPHYSEKEPLGFEEGKDKGKKLLAVAVEGSFQSFFEGKKLPLLEGDGKDASSGSEKKAGGPASRESNSKEKEQPAAKSEQAIANFIAKSPSSARIIVFASNSFLSDRMLFLASESIGSQYLNPIQLIENTADWSLEDRDLLAIRGRTHFTRTLRPMSHAFQVFFEYLNYGLAVVGLFAVWLARLHYRRRKEKDFDRLLLSTSKRATGEEQRAIEEVKA